MAATENSPLLVPAPPATPPPYSSGDVVDGILVTNGHLSHHCNGVDGGSPSLLHHQKASIKVYRTRFWILAVFSFMAFFQCLMWNTWGPLSASVNAAYPGWGSDTVAMMGNWGTITFVLFVTPMCWFMNTKGLRAGVLLNVALIAAGVVARIVPFLTSSTTFFTVMCHVCSILVGTSGTLVMAAPPLIAAVWFPHNERTTAMAVAQVFNALGNGGSYLEPLMVREPSASPSPEEVQEIQGDIRRLLYIWAGIGVGLLVAVLLYFPTKPSTPPSLTSHVERFDFMASAKMMYRNRDLWLVMASYSLNLGVPSAWASVLNYSLYDLGMDQDSAMWLGMAEVGMTVLTTLIVGRFTDMMYGHIKLSLMILIIGNLACFYWFFLLSWGSIPITTWQIYVSVVGGFAFNFATTPLFMELAVESAYPCSEVMVGGILTGGNNFVGLIFLFIFLIPSTGYQWVTYALLATIGGSLLLLMFVREGYSRSQIDRDHLQSAYQPI